MVCLNHARTQSSFLQKLQKIPCYALFCWQVTVAIPVGVVHPSSSSSTTQSVGDVLLHPATPRLLSLESLEGKGATSMELHNVENKEEALLETCSKTCKLWVAHAVQKVVVHQKLSVCGCLLKCAKFIAAMLLTNYFNGASPFREASSTLAGQEIPCVY